MHGFVVNPTFLIYFKWALDALAEMLRGRQGEKKRVEHKIFRKPNGKPRSLHSSFFRCHCLVLVLVLVLDVLPELSPVVGLEYGVCDGVVCALEDEGAHHDAEGEGGRALGDGVVEQAGKGHRGGQGGWKERSS